MERNTTKTSYHEMFVSVEPILKWGKKNIYFFNFEPLFIKVTKQEKESKFRKYWESVKVA